MLLDYSLKNKKKHFIQKKTLNILTQNLKSNSDKITTEHFRTKFEANIHQIYIYNKTVNEIQIVEFCIKRTNVLVLLNVFF